jgi:hypothetical protein
MLCCVVVPSLLGTFRRTLLHRNGQTPLHWAATYGHADVVRLLVKLNAHIDAEDNYGYSSVFRCCGQMCAAGPDRCMRQMHCAAQRCDLWPKCRGQLSPCLQGVVRSKRQNGVCDRLQLLCAKYARLAQPLHVCGRATPLHFAAREGRADIIRTLLAAGADESAMDAYGYE